MKTKRGFSEEVLTAIRDSHIIGLRAGTQPHRFIGLWAVVVEKRVFVRSWGHKPNSWHRVFLAEPRGTIQVGVGLRPTSGREIPVRAVQTRSVRLKDAVDKAYLAKYTTPSSIKYARDLGRARSRATTTELVPLT